MDKTFISTTVAPTATQQDLLVIESFLSENYLFRRNILAGQVEFTTINAGEPPKFRELSKAALNSICIRAKREGVLKKGSSKTDIKDYLESEEIPDYNPAMDFIEHLPEWDGRDRIADFFKRIPGINSELIHFATVWMLSLVAHMMQLDKRHGNECVLTLIGAQGCGKTTFTRSILPPELQKYRQDAFNLANRFDKESGLTNFLIVNLDELEAIPSSQHAKLKQALSASKVNGRPIFGRAPEERRRFASFVATTNNPHPLTDVTGNRRYICIPIPNGQQIDNATGIDYEQLYSQIVYELTVLKTPYWFNKEEVARIQELNQQYTDQKDIAKIILACFRKPEEGEKVKSLNSTEIIGIIQESFPSVKCTHGTKVCLGTAMKELGFEHKEHSHVAYYKAVPLKTA